MISKKSYAFAIRVIKAYKFIIENKKEYVLSKQLLRSGTSIQLTIDNGKLTVDPFLLKQNRS